MVTATYLFINILNGYDPVTFTDQYRPADLLSYIHFLRNFNTASWDLNPTLWFMQAIFGLYILFPFLVALQKKSGLKSVLLAAAFLVGASRFIYAASGLPIDREGGSFLFYTLEFAIGMALVETPARSNRIMNGSMSAWCFLIAFVGYAVSYLLKMEVEVPANLHDV
ncbi:MAG TPA: acyltransferase family protein, partial [Candidatus Limnocylindrales bacterium]|nr:acyltransferase family protein [Candidatus Limnocylindrales bacterium]